MELYQQEGCLLPYSVSDDFSNDSTVTEFVRQSFLNKGLTLKVS